MNANKLEQDHPCVVEMIRSKFMIPPAAVTEPYQLDDPREIMPILMRPKLDADANHLLKNKVIITNYTISKYILMKCF